MKISGLQKISLIDYPDHLAAIIFTQGCNFRCVYCHNSQLINCQKNGSQNPREVLDFLKNRQKKLDGIVITGGEPTLQPDLPEFIKQIRNLGFKVKLDTNGSNSIMLKQLIDHKLIDYIAMDVKAPLEKYHLIVGKKINTSQVKQSIKHIIASGIDHEFRTTYVDHLLSLNDIKDIIKLLSGARKYYLQNYVDNQNVLNHLNSQPLNLNWQIELSKLFSGSIGVR